jgi:hypothetical protein
VTGVPSAFVMCASYFAWPSASVSTRTIVPLGTFAFAAAWTFAAVSPVSGVSSLRWPPHGFDLVPDVYGNWTIIELNGAVEFTAEYNTDGDVFDSAASELARSAERVVAMESLELEELLRYQPGGATT